MDPATLALIIAAALAATGIKRAAKAPASAPEDVPVPEPTPEGFPPNIFTVGGLRPAVTHRAVGAERLVGTADSAEGPGRSKELGVEPASPGGVPGFGRATSALASGVPADFAGAPTAPGGAVSQSARGGPSMFQWITPLSGRYQGQPFLVQAGSSHPGTKPIGGPVAG